jgi:hypothetical protein
MPKKSKTRCFEQNVLVFARLCFEPRLGLEIGPQRVDRWRTAVCDEYLFVAWLLSGGWDMLELKLRKVRPLILICIV